MDHNAKNHHLGVNKLGKSIRKSPLHQTGFQKIPPLHHQHPPPQLPQPQVYNISKSDFRSVVQQLTGSPSRDPAVGNSPVPSRPVQQKLPSSRLMKIRPPPLTPIARPPPPPFQNTMSNPNPIPNSNSNGGFHPRPAPSPTNAWAESPVSAYMRYLQSSLLSSDSSRQNPAQGLLPSPRPPTAAAVPFLSPKGNLSSAPASLPSPATMFPLPSPGAHFPWPSPNSLLPLPSPSSFFNILSPRSSYPLLSPGFQHPQSSSPNFSFSSMSQSGILGPVPGSQPPPSPSLLFPLSPSGFLPLHSPRWREM